MPQYSGIWTEQAVMQAVGAGNWPGNPGAPTIGTATAGDASASVTFTAPTDNGGSAITGYTVTSSPGGLTGTGASSPITVSGLTNGTAYTFTVRATNATGTGPASAASNSVTPAEPVYIEQTFSTYLYSGTGSAQTITNSIDLSTKGGLVWIKDRASTSGPYHALFDTNRGAGNVISSNSTDANNPFGSASSLLTSFGVSGFSLGTDSYQWVNKNTNSYVSWTFRKQPKFFDVVTYSGNSTAGRTVAHNLGSVPGCMIVKDLLGGPWYVYHQSLGNTKTLVLNSSTNAGTDPSWNNTTPTSTVFTLGDNYQVNYTGHDYVAYLFAHNAGGFGLTGTDNVISCGSYTGNGAAGGQLINLGYEAQWVMIKNASSAADWWMLDTMRGWVVNGDFGSDQALFANSSAAEQGQVAGQPDALGFRPIQDNVNQSGQTYIYIAIRRGPMKVPTSGTSVFSPVAETPSGSANYVMNSSSGFPVDMLLYKERSNVATPYLTNRLTNNYLQTASTAAEASYTYGYDLMQGVRGQFNAASQVDYAFRRAPSFFDEVCYTGTGSNITLNHNLGAVPELMIFKTRTGAARAWGVYSSAFGVNKKLILNTTAAVANDSFFVDTTPTATVFYPGNADESNEGGNTYVAYLFATCAGVSKVGSYTGTGALQTINCGFAAGARFVLIKRTDSTGDWYTYDSARGITSGNDPYLFLNSAAAEVTGTNYVDTTSVGFQVTAAAPADLNASGGTYIFLAIA